MFTVYHSFRLKDPGGPPLGLDRMSARDAWRYDQSLSRYRKNHGEQKPLLIGEVGRFVECVIIGGLTSKGD